MSGLSPASRGGVGGKGLDDWWQLQGALDAASLEVGDSPSSPASPSPPSLFLRFACVALACLIAIPRVVRACW